MCSSHFRRVAVSVWFNNPLPFVSFCDFYPPQSDLIYLPQVLKTTPGRYSHEELGFHRPLSYFALSTPLRPCFAREGKKGDREGGRKRKNVLFFPNKYKGKDIYTNHKNWLISLPQY